MSPTRTSPPRALRGLKPTQAQQLQRAMALLQTQERALAGLLLLDLAREVPEHPEVLRVRGQYHAAEGRWPQAAALLAQAWARRPDDLALLLQLAAAQDQADDYAGHVASLQAAAGLARSADDWLRLSLQHDQAGDLQGAYGCVQQALALAPALTPALAPAMAVARLQRARCAMALGHGEQAAADCRALIARHELEARAWFMLADLKVVRLSDAELVQLQATAARPPASMPAEERLYLLFALGKALEDAGRQAEAFAALQRANDAAAARRPWDGAAFERQVRAVQAAFASDTSAPPGAQPGSEVIFLVGMPRSGTTLVEQIIGSHPLVEAASELPYLPRVIEAESQRLGQAFPAWVASATPADWARMGQDYLRMSARWRSTKPIATDKLPENWLYAAAALRMLPGARIVDCRRDPLETCWSCYKQLFGPGMLHATYRFEDLATHWRAYDRLSRHWAQQLPGRYIVQHHEALVSEPEPQMRALLAACGLPFDAACLSFHTTQRAIRTPSALQVRRPLQRASKPGSGYGDLLQPLRALLVSAEAPGSMTP